MCDKDLVYDLYFNKHMKVVEIAKKCNVSQPAISKILKKHPNLEEEKKMRKEENRIRHNKKIAECTKKRRERKSLINKDEENIIMAQLYEWQAQEAMSRRRNLSDSSIVSICAMHYDFKQIIRRKKDKNGNYCTYKKDILVFNESYGKKPNDLPKTYDPHKNVINQYRNDYIQKIEYEKFNSCTEQQALR